MDPAGALLARLADDLVARGLIRSRLVEAAFRDVPRHLFLPGVPLDVAYSDEAIPTKAAGPRLLSSSSQPAMMAIMLEQLDLAPGMNVLEIGAGTGYNAALMAYVVEPAGHVTTVDIDADTAAAAAAHLAKAGAGAVEVICTDGRDGWPANAPYDRIIATAAVDRLPPAWVEQLKEDGIIVAPLGDIHGQRSTAFRRADSELLELSSVDCGFMLMRGAAL